MFSVYDEAVKRFFERIKWNGRELLVVISAQGRRFSQVKDVLKGRIKGQVDEVKGDLSNPAPICGILVSGYEPNSQLSNFAYITSFAVPENAKTTLIVQAPTHFIANVEAVFFYENRMQKMHIDKQIWSLFRRNKQAAIPVDFTDTRWYVSHHKDYEFAKMLGKTFLHIELDSLQDQSSYDSGDLSEIDYSTRLNCKLYCWLPHQPEEVFVASSYEFEFYEDSEMEEVTDTLEIEEPEQ